MTPKKLAHLVGCEVKKLLLRGGMCFGVEPVSDEKFLAKLGYGIADLPIPKSFISQYDREEFVACYRKALRSAADDSLHRADCWVAGYYPLFGNGMIDRGSAINWHEDPITSQIWPSHFWSKAWREGLKIRNDRNDSKPICEMNLHHHLEDLGKAYWITGDERYATTAVNSVLSWIQQNPPERGIHWADSLAIGIRVIVWLTVLPFFSGSNSLTQQALISIRKSLWAQVCHIERFLSTYASPNTHLIGEAAAMFLAGIFLPDHKESVRWKRTGQDILEKEIVAQFYKDGFHRERSVYYHCYAVEFYLLVMRAAQLGGLTVRDEIAHGVERALEALMYLARPDRTLPRLGDDDGGRILKLDEPSYRTGAGLLCVGALIFNRPDFKFACGAYREEALWLLGPESYQRFLQLPTNAPVSKTGVFQSSGIVMDRTRWDSASDALFFVAGEMGMLSAGHSHADCLSIELSCHGHPILVDPGSYVYGDMSWRNAFRSTISHNTVTIDEQSQAKLGERFKWDSRWSASPIQCLTTAQVTLVEATHDGYSHLSSPVRHHRTVIWQKSNYWLCVDHFEATSQHAYTWGFHFPPETRFKVDKSGMTIGLLGKDEGLAVRPVHFGSEIRITQEAGQVDPGPGWYSEVYGEKTLSRFLKVSECLQGSAARAHLLLPYGPDRRMPIGLRDLRAELDSAISVSEIIACIIEFDDYDEIVLYSPGRVNEWHWEDFSAKTELAIIQRSHGGTLRRLFLKRGSFVVWDDQVRIHPRNELECLELDFTGNIVHIDGSGSDHVEVWHQKTYRVVDLARKG